MNENQQPNIQQTHIFSKLSTYTHQILDLQACKKVAHGGVKAFDDYMCTSVNVKKCILSYIVNENYQICYSVQYIKVQDLYISTMLCTFYVYTG